MACRSRFPYDETSGNEGGRQLPSSFSANRQPRQNGTTAMACRSGEILLGHTNAHHEKAPGPMVPFDEPSRATWGLESAGAARGISEFRPRRAAIWWWRELQQRVAEFWKSLQAGAALIRAHDPGATHVTADWLAERVIGRTIDGHLLCPGGAVLCRRIGMVSRKNDFRFKA